MLTHAKWPAISCINLYSHHLLTEPVRVVNGHQRVPDGPSLGVEVAVERFGVPQEVLDENASPGELFIHPKRRLINVGVYPDGTCLYMDGLAAPGTYVEGVCTEILDDDGGSCTSGRSGKGRWSAAGRGEVGVKAYEPVPDRTGVGPRRALET